MNGDLLAVVLRLVGWAFIPDRLTAFLIPQYYKYVLRRPGPPQIGSIQYAKTYRWTYGVVILSYLVFNLVQAAWSQPPNFYQLLGVDLDADENQIKTAFRKFAIRNHPDKVGTQGEALFMVVRDAYESLKDSTKRFAYERFGPDALTWENVRTQKEYMYAGITHASGFYIGTFFFMIVYAVLGGADSGTIWRFLLFFYLLFSELSLCLSPASTPSASSEADLFPLRSFAKSSALPLTVLRFIFPRWVPYQHVSLLHQLYIALSIAIARVGPVVFPEPSHAGAMSAREELAWKGIVQRLVALTTSADFEVTRILQSELTAIQGVSDPPRPAGGVASFPDESTIKLLEAEMETLGIDVQVLNNPTVRTMWNDAIIRRRAVAAAPHPKEGDADHSDDRATVVGDESPVEPPGSPGIHIPSPITPKSARTSMGSQPASPIVPLSPTFLTQPRRSQSSSDQISQAGPTSPKKLARPDLTMAGGAASSDLWVRAMAVEGGSM